MKIGTGFARKGQTADGRRLHVDASFWGSELAAFHVPVALKLL